MKLTMGKEASSVTKQYTEITVGRPTALEHRHPFDNVRRYANKNTTDPKETLNAGGVPSQEVIERIIDKE
ncbi:MAG: hypothetical protein JETT_0505 [Candidatus Jettenia ecosi]|uniref:Uncharacterized protein n=1 Tax=Candidatus Jettenia ecosi TaxID=2494326 RepID=A0A533QKA4_9BACT|nr:MAG: hypothetical protein JETT_0505 [Candidatus Jettenia ecosi]